MGWVSGLEPSANWGGQRRSDQVDQPLDLASVQAHASLGQQVVAGRLVAFFGRRPCGQTHQRRRKAVDQAQRLIERTPSGAGGGLVEIVPAQGDGAKERVDVLGPLGMTFFSGLAGVAGHVQAGLAV